MNNNLYEDEVEQRAEDDAERADVMTAGEPEVYVVSDVEEIEHSTALVVQQAEAIEITTDKDYEAAGEFLVDGVNAGLARIAKTFDPIDKAQKHARKVTIAERKALEQPLLDAKKVVTRLMATYWQQQEIVRKRAAQEQLDAARRVAEDQALEEAARLEREGRNEAAEDRLRQPVVPVVEAAPAPPPQA
ncbi:hypothetical protein LCGC14_2736120, partial [marine sediment metagenome]